MVIFYISIFLSLLFSIPDYSLDVDRKNIFIGESIHLTLSIFDSDEDPEISNLNFSDWEVISGPNRSSSSNISWINGKMEKSSTNIIEWSLFSLKTNPQKVIIPSINISFNDSTVKSKPIIINISERKKTDKNIQFFIEASVNNKNPYRGEQIVLSYTLYTKVDISSIDEKLPIFKGFWTEELFNPNGNIKLKEIQKNDQSYYSATIKKVALFPTKSGDLKISPMVTQIGVKDRRKNTFSVFGSPVRQHTIVSNPISIKVKPLPDTKLNINSAVVGNWNIETFIKENEFIQDEAFSFKVVISGSGNLKTADILPINFPESLETFDPEITINRNKKNYNSIAGNKTIEYVIIPRESGKIKLPSIRLLYFDVKTKKWITRKSKSKIINIKESNKHSIENYGLSKKEIQLIGEDIKFINESGPLWKSLNSKILGLFEYCILILIILAYFLPSIIDKYRKDYYIKLNDAKHAYSKAIKVFESVDNKDIYKTINQSIFIFINIKCNLNKTEYSIEEVIDIFLKHNINQKYVSAIRIIMDKGNMQRFSNKQHKVEIEDISKIKNILEVANENWK